MSNNIKRRVELGWKREKRCRKAKAKPVDNGWTGSQPRHQSDFTALLLTLSYAWHPQANCCAPPVWTLAAAVDGHWICWSGDRYSPDLSGSAVVYWRAS